jgi:hypothetical protein
MSDGYTPREGSIAKQVIDALESGDVGSSITAAQVAADYGCTATSVSTALKPAVDAGLLVATKEGRCTHWSLPEPGEPGDGRLQIANHSDGDVTVKGHGENTDGSITFTGAQIRQLLEHVTTPHIALSSITNPLRAQE